MHKHHATHAGAAHGSLKAYLTGFVLSIILTVIPFGVVMQNPGLPHAAIVALILVFAVVQIVVHLIYFLHMNGDSEQRWNVIAFAFTILVVVLVVGGSVWIMYNTTTNLMPMPDLTHQE